ncbi:MAG: membrane protein insertion efficiency factor YidD [Lentisphaeraceae bacterium]|nr:membrane protein insertion efficiency factor YidD [Lentisphaeraceae bacterium]
MKKVFRVIVRIPSRILLAFIWFYRNGVSPFFPAVCRFHPTCSQFSAGAVKNFGFIKGLWLSSKRIFCCHPYYKGDLYDPVPPIKESDLNNHG